MGVTRIDPDWVRGYAKKVDQSSDEMSDSFAALRESPLRAEAFGELGREVGTAEAYARACTALHEQLSRGCESLKSASEALHQVVGERVGADEDSAAEVARTRRD